MTLALCVAAPLAGAMVIALLGGRLRRGGTAALGGISLALACAATLAMAQAFGAGEASLVAEIGPWLPVRGSAIALVASAASIPPLLIASVLPMVLVGIAARGGRPAAGPRFFAGAALLGAAIATVAVAADLLLVAAGWQLAGFATYLLMSGQADRLEAAASATRAFALHRAGDIAFLVAVASSFAVFRTTDIGEITRRIDPSLPQDALERLVAAATLPSALVAIAVIATGAMPLRAVLAGWRGAPLPVRALASALAVAPAALVLMRLSALMHPAVLGVGAVAAVAVLLPRFDPRGISRVSSEAAQGLEAGIEGAIDRIAGAVTSVLGRATSLSGRMERSDLRVREAILLAAAVGLLAYWSLR